VVSIKLFGKPYVTVEGQLKEISLKKSEAVLYYIAMQKRVTRDELINLIWPDIETSTAKKNLRNCLYRLKKDLGTDVFTCPNKNAIHLRDDLALEDTSSSAFLKDYDGRFLMDFTLQDCLLYEDWMRDVEQQLNERYLAVAHQAVATLEEKNAYREAIDIALKMQRIDSFNEAQTRHLMRLYAAVNDFAGIITAYQTLKETLSAELGIMPDVETSQLYSELLSSRQNTREKRRIYGREAEQKIMLSQIEKARCTTSENGFALIIKGEAGVGKTALCEAVCHQLASSTLMASANCYQVETHFNLKAWNDIIRQIDLMAVPLGIFLSPGVKQVLAHVFPCFIDETTVVFSNQIEQIKYGYIEKIICDYLRQIAEKKPVLIRFEDIQWMDEMGLRLLTAVALHCKGVVIVATMRNEVGNAIDQVLRTLQQYKCLNLLELKRFDVAEANAFIDYLSKDKLTAAFKERIYEESEGNAFFMVEMLQLDASQLSAFDQKLSDLLGARFLGLSDEVLKVAHIMAMFFDGAPLDMLKQMIAQDDETLLESIQILMARYLIKEEPREGTIAYHFTHHKLRVYLYESMGRTKRNMLHHRIAETWKKRLTHPQRDILIYQKLIYHYRASDDTVEHLTYYLEYLEQYFDISHELYPEFPGYGIGALDDQPELCFSRLNQLILTANQRNIEIKALTCRYHLLYGRYLIRQGYYEVGLKEIKQLLNIANDKVLPKLAYKGNVQWIYYAIQVGDSKQLEERIAIISDMMPQRGKERAVITRFEGILAMMRAEYNMARRHFERSIQHFNALDDIKRYALNIAAAYNYIADSYRHEQRYDDAIKAVNLAIETCHAEKIERGLAIFYTNAGLNCYFAGALKEAKDAFQTALSYYEQRDVLWRRGIAEAYMGILCLEEGHIDEAKVYLKKATRHAVHINNPETQTAILKLEALVQKA